MDYKNTLEFAKHLDSKDELKEFETRYIYSFEKFIPKAMDNIFQYKLI